MCNIFLSFSDKMPRSKTGKTRDAVDSERMKNALMAVTAMDGNKISLREACKVYNVKLTTLSRQLKTFRQLGPEQYCYKSNFDIHKVFSEEEEELLVDYILKISKMNYGLSKKGVRQLAFKYALANGKSIPETWKDGKIAGEQWMRHFMQRHSSGSRALSIRKPEPTSLSRSTSFNKTNVDSFFDNIEDVHKRFGPIPPPPQSVEFGRNWVVNSAKPTLHCRPKRSKTSGFLHFSRER